MTSQNHTDGTGIRETFEELDVDDQRVGRISDPENDRAWIQSDVYQPVET